MFRSKVCLSLTGSTLAENIEVLKKYRNTIDIVELRADYLNKDERLFIRRFPELAKIPCILTIRRAIDGGLFTEGEASRTILFARALAFANQDVRKNFAYIDLESDFNVPSIQDASLAFDTRIIRSYYTNEGTIKNIGKKIASMRLTGYEIPKVAITPRTLSDVTDLFFQTHNLKDGDFIISVMGQLSLPARILSSKLNSYLTYTMPKESISSDNSMGCIDPITLSKVYNYDTINDSTKIFGIAGNSIQSVITPIEQNIDLGIQGRNTVFIPLLANKVEEVIEFAEQLNIEGISMLRPFNNSVLHLTKTISEEAGYTGVCNFIMHNGEEWTGHNNGVSAMHESLSRFLGRRNLIRQKVSIIGAGSMARTAAYVVKMMHGKACIFNRTISHAKNIADLYNFKWASLSEDSQVAIANYSDVIIQTTIAGMAGSDDAVLQDPIPNYEFHGNEYVFDCVYTSQQTPIIMRSSAAGCHTSGGMQMMQIQMKKQLELFTGVIDDRKSIVSK